jgi:hypothetical protein
MGFNFVDIAITVRSENVCRLRRDLPLLGNDYAEVCKKMACLRPGCVCANCSKQEVCGWYIVFGQKLSTDAAALKRHQKPPLPFVFSFPIAEPFSEGQDEIECGLVVIGHSIPYLGMLLEGFSKLLSDRFFPESAEIISVACRDYQGSIQPSSGNYRLTTRSRNLVPENLVIISTEGLLESHTWTNSDLHIRLLSPLRLIDHGSFITRFEFSRFARSTMRRVSSMAYYYGESEFDCDFKEISRQIDKVICSDSYFCYSSGLHKKTSGVTGYGSFLGDFSQLMPFIIIGSYIHIGKGSSFGMGAYEVFSGEQLNG